MARPLSLRPQILSSLARQSLPRFLQTQKPSNPSSPKPYVTSPLNPKRANAISVHAVSQARRFSVSRIVTRAAANVNDAGSVDSPLMQSMQTKIKEELNAESVSVKDAYGDGRHVSIDVVSAAFEGKSAVNRQRMVYKAIWEELQSVVHAVDQMTTLTPEEAGSKE